MPQASVVALRSPGTDSQQMGREVREALRQRQPALPSKYFYDELGSQLFDEITRLPEYYQTRTELSIIEQHVDDIVRGLRPSELIELGSGVGLKTRRFLDAMQRHGTLQRCTLLDVAEAPLQASVVSLSALYHGAAVGGLIGDFAQDLGRVQAGDGRLLMLLAGTIGNFERDQARALLRQGRQVLGADSAFLVGLDLVKDPRRLERAYNDKQGVTARFNRNILAVINARLGANFALDAFDHIALYNVERARIEMHLRSRCDQSVEIPGAEMTLELARGETLLTEISCKFTRRSFMSLLQGTGLELERWYTDPDQRFALAQLCPSRQRAQQQEAA